MLKHIALVERRMIKMEALVAKQRELLSKLTLPESQMQVGRVLLTRMTETLAVLKEHHAIISETYRLSRGPARRREILLRVDHHDHFSAIIDGKICATIDKIDGQWWLRRVSGAGTSSDRALNVTAWVFDLPAIESIIDLHLRGHLPWKLPPTPIAAASVRRA